jgi:hypothetical protein
VTALNFSTVLAAVFTHVRFVVPGSDRCRLHSRAHGAAVIGAVEQEVLEQGRISGDEARAHAGHVGALRQAGEHDQPLETAAEHLCRLHATERRIGFVKENSE